MPPEPATDPTELNTLRPGWQLAVLGLLAALGVAINYHPLTVFFDVQVLLGGSLGVLAVLGLGLRGLPVGMAAALVTLDLWGHPWAALSATLELSWLVFFLARLNGGSGQRDNGRVVLADTAYWVFFGVGLETLLYSRAMGLPVEDTFLIAAKQGVNGVIHTLIGFVLYLIARGWLLGRARTPGNDAQRALTGISVRGASSAAVLLAITVPMLLITVLLSHQINTALLNGVRMEMRAFGLAAADGDPIESLGEGAMAFERRTADGRVSSSNPALFERLREQYSPRIPNPSGLPDLQLHHPNVDEPVLAGNISGYWVHSFDQPASPAGAPAARMTVVNPAHEVITLITEQMGSALLMLAVLILLGALASQWLGRLLEIQFQRVMAPIAATTSEAASRSAATSGAASRSATTSEAASRSAGSSEAASRSAGSSEAASRSASTSEAASRSASTSEAASRSAATSEAPPRSAALAGGGAPRAEGSAPGEGDQVMVDLGWSTLRELNSLVAVVNERSRRGNSLTRSLREANSELEAAERDLLEARDRAEAANRAKSVFLATMSHEIRTPMAGIIGMTQLALRAAGDATQRARMDKVVRSARSLLRILNDILDFSKIEAGKLAIERAPFKLRSAIADVTQLVEPGARERGLVLEQELDPALSPWYLGDALRLKQVLTNLLDNAVKFTEAGSVRLTVREPRPGRLAVTVSDTGIGMTAEQCERLFHPFAQAETHTARRFGGTGLGLFISRQLVELMDGHIEVTSVPGRGSLFSFEVAATACDAPLAKRRTRAGQPREEAESLHPVEGEFKGRRVLLVEDNPLNREVVAGLLEHTGLSLYLAEDGRRGLELFAHEPFDLVLMDVQMPGMDGYDTTRGIRALDPNVPIVALTAGAFDEDLARSRAAGMNAHLSKPIDVEQLLAQMRRFLAPAPRPDVSAETPSQAPSASAEVEAQADLAALPHLDVAAGLRLAGGHAAVHRRLLGRFLEEYQGFVPRLDDPDSRRALHTLKGLCGNLDAPRLARLSAALERAEDDALLPVFQSELQAVLTEIRDWLGRTDERPGAGAAAEAGSGQPPAPRP